MAEEPRWGWHQLTDPARLVAACGVRPGDLVLDVGAGTGGITAALVDVGARVIAVELHPHRLALLRERFSEAPVTVVRADASDLRLPRQPFRVVANPPYAAMTSIVRRLLAPGSRLVRADLLMPVGMARRWTTAGAPGAGRWRHEFDVTLAARVPSHAFTPKGPPSARLALVRR